MEGRTLMSGLSLTAATVPALIADINAANTAGGANTITLTAKTTSPYLLTAVNNSTNAANGLPVIAANDNLTIVGNGDTIERNTTSPITTFRLFAVAGGGSLTLENLTLQGGGGNEGVNAIWEEGGTMYNSGTLVLNNVTVQEQQRVRGRGHLFQLWLGHDAGGRHHRPEQLGLRMRGHALTAAAGCTFPEVWST